MPLQKTFEPIKACRLQKIRLYCAEFLRRIEVTAKGNKISKTKTLVTFVHFWSKY